MADPKGVIFKDQEEQKKIGQIADQLTQATNNAHTAAQVTPAQNTIPIFAGPLAVPQQIGDQDAEVSTKREPEIVDVIKGYQGRMRTGEAKDFLKEKMKWLSKKNKGAEVDLK
jgi:hypothetical protein